MLGRAALGPSYVLGLPHTPVGWDTPQARPNTARPEVALCIDWAMLGRAALGPSYVHGLPHSPVGWDTPQARPNVARPQVALCIEWAMLGRAALGPTYVHGLPHTPVGWYNPQARPNVARPQVALCIEWAMLGPALLGPTCSLTDAEPRAVCARREDTPFAGVSKVAVGLRASAVDNPRAMPRHPVAAHPPRRSPCRIPS